jgi:hypothetical protein
MFQTTNQHVQPANPAYQLHPLTSSIWRKTGQYMKWVSKSASSRNREQLWGPGGGPYGKFELKVDFLSCK